MGIDIEAGIDLVGIDMDEDMGIRTDRDMDMTNRAPGNEKKVPTKLDNAKKMLSGLDEDQHAAAMHSKGPALVIAGPGSGKTTLIIARAVRLIEIEGVNSKELLSLTFSRAAAEEMARRYRKFSSSNAPEFSTIHAFCMSIFKKSEKNLELLEAVPGRRNKILYDIYKRINGFSPDSKAVDILSGEIGYTVNRMLDLNPAICGYNGRTRNFKKIFEAYIEYKKRMALADFDDIQKAALTHLEKGRPAGLRLNRKHRYIQVDEGQDLSPLQFNIISLLARGTDNVFMVADDDQSIYRFRGADPVNLNKFMKMYPDAKLYRITRNYRSDSNIVEISSRFISANKIRIEKSHKAVRNTCSTSDISYISCTSNGNCASNARCTRNTGSSGNARCTSSVSSARNVKNISNGSNIINSYTPASIPEIFKIGGRCEQAKEIARKIAGLRHNSESTAIIYRNNLSAVVYSYYLHMLKIPFVIKDNCSDFFEHWILKDIIKYLSKGGNKRNPGALIQKYWKSGGLEAKCHEICMIKGVSAGYANAVYENARLLAGRLKTTYEFLESIKTTKSAIKAAAQNPARVARKPAEPAARKPAGPTAGEPAGPAAGAFSTEPISAVSPEFGAMKKTGVIESASLILTTAHSSKGLEFDNVFMVDLIEGEFPSAEALAELNLQGNIEPVEEERRLFYVAMTRAKHRLYLYSPCDKKSLCSVSIFIREVENLLLSNNYGNTAANRL